MLFAWERNGWTRYGPRMDLGWTRERPWRDPGSTLEGPGIDPDWPMDGPGMDITHLYAYNIISKEI